MAQKQPIAEYTKDGVTKTAWTPTECVDLEFHGWSRKSAKSSGARKSAAKKSAAKKTAAKKAPAKAAAAPSEHTSATAHTSPTSE